MIESLPSPYGLLITIVLATLAIGLPIVFVLSIRFLLDRNLNLGRSRELEKLIWQLHRIASAMENQMNLPSSAGQQQPTSNAPAPAQNPAASPTVAPPAAAASQPVRAEQRETTTAAPQPAPVSQTAPQGPPAEGDRQGGVNSMFGL
jgi:cytoskeletal protein RodZ